MLIEDSDMCALRVIAEVLHFFPNCRLVHARNIEDARTLSFSAQVHVFLVDVNLPDGNGFDFLAESAMIHPGAASIVMTSTILPEYQQRADALGVSVLVEKPVQSRKLVDLLRVALGSVARAPAESRAFVATLMNMTPLDVIQMSCLRSSTAILEFVTDCAVGRIGIRSGEIVHAETAGLSGVDALNEIVSWRTGTVAESMETLPTIATVHGDWQMLLMNAANHIDVNS